MIEKQVNYIFSPEEERDFGEIVNRLLSSDYIRAGIRYESADRVDMLDSADPEEDVPGRIFRDNILEDIYRSPVIGADLILCLADILFTAENLGFDFDFFTRFNTKPIEQIVRGSGAYLRMLNYFEQNEDVRELESVERYDRIWTKLHGSEKKTSTTLKRDHDILFLALLRKDNREIVLLNHTYNSVIHQIRNSRLCFFEGVILWRSLMKMVLCVLELKKESHILLLINI